MSQIPPKLRLAIGGTATVLLSVVGELPTEGPWLWIDITAAAVLGVTSLASSAAGGLRERHLREVATEAGTEASANLAEGIEPVLAALEEVAKSPRGSKLEEHAKGLTLSAVTGALAAVVGPDGARSCYFDLKTGVTGLQELRPRPATWRGRGEPPRTVFVTGTAEGDAAIDMVLTGKDRFVDDVTKNPPPGWSAGSRRYQTFISVAVGLEGRPMGMLTVDALQPGDLTEASDLPTARALAKILAIALAH